MSEMTAEALQLLVDISRESSNVETVEIPETERYALLNRRTGEVAFYPTEPATRNHKIGNVDTAISEARRLKAADLSSVVWCNYGSIVILDDKSRRDRSTLSFGKSSQFKLLETLRKNPQGMQQRNFIRMLRIDLDGCLGAAGNFLSLVRQLKFTAGQDATGTIQHGKESISRSTIAELVGADSIPEEVVLTVRVYDLPFEPVRSVRCAVEIDVNSATFVLTPFPGQLEDAENAAIGAIREHLTVELDGDKIPVVFGTP